MDLPSTSTSSPSHPSKRLKTMDLITDELVLKGHTSPVRACAWNPSSLLLASGSQDFRIWPISDGTLESRPQCGPGQVAELKYVMPKSIPADKNACALEWNDEGTLLATGSVDGKLRIWSSSGELKSTLCVYGNQIFALKWNKDNTYILTGGDALICTVWDVDTLKVKQHFDYHGERVTVVDWRDNDSFTTCSWDGMIYFSKIGETDATKEFDHEEVVTCAKWDTTGFLLASCDNYRTIKLWNMEEDQYVRQFEEHKDGVNLIRWSPVGNQPSILASGSVDTTVKLWDVEQGKLLYTLNEHWDSVETIAFSPNGDYVASGAQDEIHIWSVKEGKLIKSYLSETDGVAGLCWNKEGHKIAAGFADGSVRVLNFRT